MPGIENREKFRENWKEGDWIHKKQKMWKAKTDKLTKHLTPEPEDTCYIRYVLR